MPGFIGIQEIVLFVVLLLIIFGAKRLPELGRSFCRGMSEFKDGVTGKNECCDRATPWTVYLLMSEFRRA
jgi:sec-independent protein translocase protein TatA